MSSALGYPLAVVLLSLSSCPQQVSRGRLAGPAVKAVFGNSLNQESPEGSWAEFNLPDILFGPHTIFRKFRISCQYQLRGQKTDQWFAGSGEGRAKAHSGAEVTAV